MKFHYILLAIFLQTTVFATEYAVVVYKDFQTKQFSKKQIKDIFMLKRQFINGIKILPVNLASSALPREVFEKKILKINRDRLNSYWVRKHFQGIRPPVVQKSSKAMKLFVKNVKGAIGYLPIEAVDVDLRVVYEF